MRAIAGAPASSASPTKLASEGREPTSGAAAAPAVLPSQGPGRPGRRSPQSRVPHAVPDRHHVAVDEVGARAGVRVTPCGIRGGQCEASESDPLPAAIPRTEPLADNRRGSHSAWTPAFVRCQLPFKRVATVMEFCPGSMPCIETWADTRGETLRCRRRRPNNHGLSAPCRGHWREGPP